jgi:hypothetical protein
MTTEQEVFAALAAWNRMMGYSRRERMREALHAAALMRDTPRGEPIPMVQRIADYVRGNPGNIHRGS